MNRGEAVDWDWTSFNKVVNWFTCWVGATRSVNVSELNGEGGGGFFGSVSSG